MWESQLWAFSLWCHQVFTGCWGFTAANRGSECNSQEQSECFFFHPSCFYFLKLQRCTYSFFDIWLHAHRCLNISFFFFSPPSSFPLSFQASVNTELVRCLSRTARGTLPPLAAAVGGLASQEVLKALTGKFAPLQQWVDYYILTVDLFYSLQHSYRNHYILCF